MRVLMLGRAKSIAFEELEKYWGEVIYSPPRVFVGDYDLVVGQEPTLRVGLPGSQLGFLAPCLYARCRGYLSKKALPLKDRYGK